MKSPLSQKTQARMSAEGQLSRIRDTSKQSGRPLITVATVVLNAAPVLQYAIRSVLSQRYDAIEFVVIDGGSTDGTLDLIREHEAGIDYWISEPDRGIYDAMNKALAVARGDWILFLGADDEILIQIDSIVSAMTDTRAVYYGDVEIKKTGEIYGGRFTRYKLMQQNICHQAIFYPRSVYGSKPYDTQVGVLADHKYNIELWGRRIEFRYLGRVISRFNDAGLSSGDQKHFEAIKMMAIKSNLGPLYYVIKRVRTAIVAVLKRFFGFRNLVARSAR